MKYLLIVCLFYVVTVNSAPLDLNAENLTILALKSSSKETVNSYAKTLAKSKYSKTYFKYIKDKEKRLQFIAKIEKDLKQEIADFPSNPDFIVVKPIKLQNIDLQNNQFSVTGFSKDVSSIFRNYKKSEGLPDFFFLLYSNMEMLEKITSNKNVFKKFIGTSKVKGGYVEAIVKLQEFQNQQEFQVVIKNISVFTDKDKKLLLAEKKEIKQPEKIVNSWLLAGGYTNKLIGIHSFSVFGYRLHDMIDRIRYMETFCKKTKVIGKHLEIKCEKQYSKNVKLVTKYLGGKFSQLNLIATNKPSVFEQEKIINKLVVSLNQSKSFFIEKNQKWNNYSVDFEYFTDAFFSKGIDKNIFNFEKNKYEPTLIFTMMSQTTKKLIQESK